MAGKNLFGLPDNQRLMEKRANAERPCIFISHSSKDKSAARTISAWIMKRDLNVYFDENDQCLKAAMHLGEPHAIVKCIQDGLKKSDYAICIMSRNTLESQWVPYEMGYFHSDKDKRLALVVLTEVTSLPQFYKVADVLADYPQLDGWIDRILQGTTLLRESLMQKNATYTTHPLFNTMARSKNVTYY